MILLLVSVLMWLFECIYIYSWIFSVPLARNAWKKILLMMICAGAPLAFYQVLPKFVFNGIYGGILLFYLFIMPIAILGGSTSKNLKILPMVCLADYLLNLWLSNLYDKMLPHQTSENMINAIADVTEIAVIFLVGIVYHKIKGKKVSPESYKNYAFVSIIIFCLISTVIIFNNISVADHKDLVAIQERIPYITTALGLAIAALFLILNDYQEKTTQYAEEMDQLKKNLDTQQKYFVDRSARDDTRKMIMHDMRAHLIAMKQLSEDDNYDELNKYIEKLCDSYSGNSLEFFSGNNYVDAVVSSLIDEAQKAGVHVEWEGTLPYELTIDQKDICSIVYNILKNAIEAARSNNSNKKVAVRIYSFNRRILIMTENSFDPKKSDVSDFTTTKADVGNHGFGLKIIQEIVRRYDGSFSIRRDGDVVITQAILHSGQKNDI